MTQDLQKRMEANTENMQEMFTKDLEKLKMKQTEVNNALEGIHNRIAEPEERMNDLEDKMLEIIAAEQNIEKRMKINEDLRDFWDNIEHSNILILGVPEERERT